jgi:RHS repeat-associated protein
VGPVHRRAGADDDVRGHRQPQSDLLYRSEALTDASGDIEEAYDTDAYGNTLVFSGPGEDGTWFTDDDTPSDQPACEYIFTGREYDPESQIYFYRARYYHPQFGRFIGPDPQNALPDLNLYQYVLSNPNIYLDATGEDPDTCQTTNIVNYAQAWNYQQTVPGVSLGGMDQMTNLSLRAVYYQYAYEKLKCCDCSNSVYFRWFLNVNIGTATSAGGAASALGTCFSAPVPLPVYIFGVEDAINLGPLLGQFCSFNNPNTVWAGRPPMPTVISGLAPLPNNVAPAGLTPITIVNTVNCTGPFPPTPVPQQPSFPA